MLLSKEMIKINNWEGEFGGSPLNKVFSLVNALLEILTFYGEAFIVPTNRIDILSLAHRL